MTTSSLGPLNLTFDQIISGGSTRFTRVEIPEIVVNDQPGIVYFRQLSARDVMDFADLSGDSDEAKKARADMQYTMLAKALVDADGHQIVDTPEKLATLPDMPIKVFTGLMGALTRFLGLVDEVKSPVTATATPEAVNDLSPKPASADELPKG